MNETSSADGKRSGTKPARPRALTHVGAERQRAARAAGFMFVFAIMAAVVLVILAALPKLGQPNAAMSPGMSDNDLRTARITSDLDGKGCAQQVFDNQTGHMTSTPEPCQTTMYDGNGVPIPVGTIHRLDSISKSFSGH
jgi:hypothetical protein